MVKTYYSYKLDKSIGCGSTQILSNYQQFKYREIACTFVSGEEILSIISLSNGEIMK